jgi:hypothetical protein
VASEPLARDLYRPATVHGVTQSDGIVVATLELARELVMEEVGSGALRIEKSHFLLHGMENGRAAEE